MDNKDKLEIETVLSKFSIFSSFYLKLFVLLIFSAGTNQFYNLNYVFAASDSDYRCSYPKCGDPEVYETSLLDKCYYNGTCSNNTDNALVKCTEWLYDDEFSFLGEFNLGCEEWKRSFVGFIHIFGYMLGLLIIGPLSDKFGRKTLIIFTGIVSGVTGLLKSMARTYWTYAGLELVEALLGDTYSTTVMLGVEMITKKHRAALISLITASSALAGMLMAAIASALPYWRNFLCAIYAPSLLFLLYIFLLDESPRWLLITGKKNKLKELITKFAKASNVDVNVDDLNDVTEESQKGANVASLLAKTFSSKKLLLRFLACVCMWTAALFNKYALFINSVELEGNKYINFALTSFAELPASVALVFVLNRYKRRVPLLCSLILTGVFCIGQSFVPKGNVTLSTLLFVIGKFMATISHSTVYLYTSELFPTYTRNTMLALSSSLGRMATLLAPQTPLLKRYWRGLPSTIVGGVSLLTGAVVMFMPDTAEIVLPDTVKQAEAVGEKNPDGIDCTKL